MSGLPPGFEGFDVPTPTRQESARVRVERKLHESPQMLDSTPMLKTRLVDRIWLFRKSGVWFIDAGDVDKAAAVKLGKRVQKELKGRRTLTYDVPYMHYLELYVGYGSDYVQLPPLMTKANVEEPMNKQQEKDIIRTLVKAGHETLAKSFARSRGYRVKAGRFDAGTFIVVVNKSDPRDSHAAEDEEKALEVAMFDEGTRYDVYEVDAKDPGAARLQYKKGKKLRSGVATAT